VRVAAARAVGQGHAVRQIDLELVHVAEADLKRERERERGFREGERG